MSQRRRGCGGVVAEVVGEVEECDEGEDDVEGEVVALRHDVFRTLRIGVIGFAPAGRCVSIEFAT